VNTIEKLTNAEQSPFKKDIGWYGISLTNLTDAMLTRSVNKILVVCPVTLVDNWKKEFKKWQAREVIS